ncbi:MAG: DUF4116 domain-containing protein [Brevinematia bacterium]
MKVIFFILLLICGRLIWSTEQNTDKESLIKALSNGEISVLDIPEDFKKDKDFILNVIDIDPMSLRFLGSNWQSNKEIVKTAVNKNGKALKFASSNLKKDKEIVFLAVKNEGSSLEYADFSLRRNKEIVLEAVKNNPVALKYADESFKNSKKFLYECIKYNPAIIDFAGNKEKSTLKKDKNLFLVLLKEDWWYLRYASSTLLKDKDFVNKAFTVNPFVIYFPSFEKKLLTSVNKENLNDFEKLISKLGFINPFKFYNKRIFDIATRQRISPQKDNFQPLSVIIDTGFVGNRADIDFRVHNVEELSSNGYRVSYYQVKSDIEFVNSIKDAALFQSIDVLLINGHGREGRIVFWKAGTNIDMFRLSNTEYQYKDEEILDLNDGEKLKSIKGLFSTNSVIVISSCSAGKGGEKGANIANMIHKELPDVEIFAPLSDISKEQLYFDENGKITNVYYFPAGSGFYLPERTYNIKPALKEK